MSKVLVGMSGGVDSLVSAIILKNQGFHVVGATLPICGGLTDKTAEKLCKLIGISFQKINIGNLFKIQVIDYFKNSLLSNETPNPCVVCNQYVKLFGLHKYAIENKFDHVSTGHYARIADFGSKTTVLRGADPNKDQSYMLCAVPEEILKMTILPLGEMTRFDAEMIAQNYPTSHPSQDACFVKGSMTEWIKKEIDIGNKGQIFDKNGTLLGTHIGLRAYTIGQREGLRLSGGPWFVVSKNILENTLIVSHREDALVTEFMVRDLKIWHNQDVSVMIRYRAEPVRCQISNYDDNLAIITTAKKVFAPTPGQYAVFYFEDFVIGFGVISEK